jgi:hypothetical protein
MLGKLRNIDFSFNSSATSTNTWLLIGKVADAYKPANNVVFSFNDMNCKPMAGRILTTGEVEFVQQQGNVYQGLVNITYNVN